MRPGFWAACCWSQIAPLSQSLLFFGLLKSAMDMPQGFRSGNGKECGFSNLLTSKQRGMCAEWRFKSRKMVVISFWCSRGCRLTFGKRLSSDCEASPHAFIQLVRVARRTENSLNGGCLTLTIAGLTRPDRGRYRSTQPSACSIILPSLFEGSKLHSSVGWEPPKLPTDND